ncbi:hypothetical protein EJB05_33304, partial [Eragrostis curvula]
LFPRPFAPRHLGLQLRSPWLGLGAAAPCCHVAVRAFLLLSQGQLCHRGSFYDEDEDGLPVTSGAHSDLVVRPQEEKKVFIEVSGLLAASCISYSHYLQRPSLLEKERDQAWFQVEYFHSMNVGPSSLVILSQWLDHVFQLFALCEAEFVFKRYGGDCMWKRRGYRFSLSSSQADSVVGFVTHFICDVNLHL